MKGINKFTWQWKNGRECNDGSCDIHYLASFGDVLSEDGPHGITIWDATTVSAPVSPLGVFEYGVFKLLIVGENKGIKMYEIVASDAYIENLKKTIDNRKGFRISEKPQT